jgi:hypothetical protein
MPCFIEPINISEEVSMSMVQFTNMLQLKIIEQHYGLSSVFEPEEFNVAFMQFVANKGPQKLREILDEQDTLVEYHYNEDKPWTHEEMVFLSQKIFRNSLQGE